MKVVFKKQIESDERMKLEKDQMSDEGCRPFCKSDNRWKALSLRIDQRLLNILTNFKWCDNCKASAKEEGIKCLQHCVTKITSEVKVEHEKMVDSSFELDNLKTEYNRLKLTEKKKNTK